MKTMWKKYHFVVIVIMVRNDVLMKRQFRYKINDNIIIIINISKQLRHGTEKMAL